LTVIPDIDFKSSHNESRSPLQSVFDTSKDPIYSSSPLANSENVLSNQNISESMKDKKKWIK
jgi:hypothetical protein